MMVINRRFSLAIVAIVAAFIGATPLKAQDCLDDPDVCAGPRSWMETFDEDPLVASPGDWQQRNGTQAMPDYDDGMAIFDGLVAPWMLIDSADHFFEGETRIHIIMDANPEIGAPDLGAGWWVNADNEGIFGGFYAINGVLARNDVGDQEYRFGPAWAGVNEVIPVAEGGIEARITLLPDEDEQLMVVSYAITDVDETHTGEFEIFGAQGPNMASPDKWFTLFANNSGQGLIDYVEVINQPAATLPGDYNGNGELDAEDLDYQAEVFLGIRPESPEYDANGDGSINATDRTYWLSDLKMTWIGDSNFDFQFNTADFVAVLSAGEYETGERAGWAKGDWNGDLVFGTADLVAALAAGGYEKGPYSGGGVAAVPEPSGLLLWLLGAFALIRRRQ